MDTKPVVGDLWFRYEDHLRANISYDGEPTGSHVEVSLHKFRVEKVTPQGVRLRADYGAYRGAFLVLDHWVKKFACPTLELARQSFIKRKQRQIGIYKARVRCAEEAIALMQGKVLT